MVIGDAGYIVSPSLEIKIGTDSGHVGGTISSMILDGGELGVKVGPEDGEVVGVAVGVAEGAAEGEEVGVAVGVAEGEVVGVAVGVAEGEEVGLALGLVLSVGDSDGAELGK